MMFLLEYWIDIPGLKNYQASYSGKIRRAARQLIDKNGVIYNLTEKILAAHPNKDGYLKIKLRSAKLSPKSYMVSRIIALTFIQNPNSLKEVNHINGIKSDNYVSNLEWCDRGYNIKHAYANGLRTPVWLGKPNTGAQKKIIQFDLNGNEIRTFQSISEAQKVLNNKGIYMALRSLSKIAAGYKWGYA